MKERERKDEEYCRKENERGEGRGERMKRADNCYEDLRGGRGMRGGVRVGEGGWEGNGWEFSEGWGGGRGGGHVML